MRDDDIAAARPWVLGVEIATMLPQWQRLPWWLPPLLLFACAWRLPVVERRLPLPSPSLRWLLFLFCLLGLWSHYHSLVGAEAGSAFLVVCMIIKLLEMRRRRDVHVLLLIAGFVLATDFLFDTSLWLGLYGLLVVVLMLAGLLALQRRETHVLLLRRALALLLQALPITLILYLFFPRLPPLWTLHTQAGTSVTGLSAVMAPGDLSHLSESDDLAFRVEFHGRRPDRSQLYWRGIVLSQFDGHAWRPAPQDEEVRPLSSTTPTARGERIDYRVTLEPTGQPWLFALAHARSDAADIVLTRGGTLRARAPITRTRRYDVSSRRVDVGTAALSRSAWQRDLQLPAGNTRTRRLALAWRAAATSDAAYVRRVLLWFHGGGFVYSLDPPRWVGEPIDDFLFRTRSGFCEHYAAAFVFMMRAAGIPARVVIGYQGGQPGLSGGYWEVRQMDAHAWAEIWTQERWLRVDPTAAVAPERISHGALVVWQHQAAEIAGQFFPAAVFGWHLHVRAWLDDLDFRWRRDVLAYDVAQQNHLMLSWLGSTDVLRRALVMVAAIALLFALMALLRRQAGRPAMPAAERHYRRYCRRMAALGLPRQIAEGPHSYAERIARRRPDLAAAARALAELYSQLCYQGPDQAPDAGRATRLAQLKRLARRP